MPGDSKTQAESGISGNYVKHSLGICPLIIELFCSFVLLLILCELYIVVQKRTSQKNSLGGPSH